MQLITKEAATALAAAYAHSAETGESSKEILVKFFTPWAGATWYITEGGPLNDDGEIIDDVDQAVDWHLYGFADLGHGPDQAELGYVLLSQLLELKGPAGLRVERDLHYDGHTLADVMPRYQTPDADTLAAGWDNRGESAETLARIREHEERS